MNTMQIPIGYDANVINEWISDGMSEVISYGDNGGDFSVITKTTLGKKDVEYRLTRFFVVGTHTCASVDIAENDEKKFFAKLHELTLKLTKTMRSFMSPALPR